MMIPYHSQFGGHLIGKRRNHKLLHQRRYFFCSCIRLFFPNPHSAAPALLDHVISLLNLPQKTLKDMKRLNKDVNYLAKEIPAIRLIKSKRSGLITSNKIVRLVCLIIFIFLSLWLNYESMLEMLSPQKTLKDMFS